MLEAFKQCWLLPIQIYTKISWLMQSRPDTQSSEHYNQANYNPSPFLTTLLLFQGRGRTAWVPRTHLTPAAKFCLGSFGKMRWEWRDHLALIALKMFDLCEEITADFFFLNTSRIIKLNGGLQMLNSTPCFYCTRTPTLTRNSNA